MNFLIYITFNINVAIWLITVAIAAPSTPILNTNINIGSNIVFNIAPVSIEVIEYFGLPSALIIEFNVVPIIENGKPIAIIEPYFNAYSLKVSVHPNIVNNCGKNINVITQNIIDIIDDIAIAFPTPFAASSFFFSPSFKLRYADAPSPNINDNANPIIVNGNTTFVAPFPMYPTPQPINIWSIILYNEFTNNDIIHGIENFLINFPIFSVPNMFSSFSIFSPSLFLFFSWKRIKFWQGNFYLKSKGTYYVYVTAF